MKINLIRFSISAVVLASLAACGGGGSGHEDGPQNTIVKHEVLPAQTVTVMAGGAVPLSAYAETFGPTIKSLVWVSNGATAKAKGTLDIADPQCALGSLSSRAVPGSTKLSVGTARCETEVRVPETAEGPFEMISSVTGSDASQHSERFIVNVLPKPQVTYDFNLSAKVLDTVVLNQPIQLQAQAQFKQAIPDTAKVEYEWTLLFAPANVKMSLGTTPTTIALLPQPGTYVFMVKATFTNGDKTETKYQYLSLAVDKEQVSSNLGFSLDIETKQATVFVGSPANLVANYKIASGSTVTDVTYKWTQLQGPKATMTNPALQSIYVVPSDKGEMVFSVESSVTVGSYKETKTSIVTVLAQPVPVLVVDDGMTGTGPGTGTGTGTGTGGGTTVIGPAGKAK